MNVSPQRRRFAPDGGCPAVRAAGILTFEPRQLAGHSVQLIAQRAHQLNGLGGIAFVHGRIVASPASSRERNGHFTQWSSSSNLPPFRFVRAIMLGHNIEL